MSSWYNRKRYNGNQESAGNPFSTYCSVFNPYNSIIDSFTIKEPIVNVEHLLKDDNYNNENKNILQNSYNQYNMKNNSNNNNHNIRNENLIQNSYNIINNNPYSRYGKKSNNVTYNYNKNNQKNYITDFVNYSNKSIPNKKKIKIFNQSKLNQQQIKINPNTNNNINEEKNSIIEKTEIPKQYISTSNEIISDSESTEYYINNSNSVLEYAYKEDANTKFRNYMEDKGKTIDNFNNNPNSILFCLFDGHGGVQVSKYLQENFPIFFKKILPNEYIELKIIDLFPEIDNILKENNFYQVGSTACIIYITKENNKKFLYCANVGDTRCIILRNDSFERLSYDDRASDDNEYNRIINNGGIVFGGRVYGQLMLSRAFGDWELKNYGVISVPHVKRIEICENDKFVVIGSDGIWDVLNDSDVYNMSFQFRNSKDFCDNIIKSAIEKGTMDNISCFVIKLN